MNPEELRSEMYAELRNAYGGEATFRDGQEEAILGVLQGKRTLVVQRTGWGKSLVYFMATRILRKCGNGFTLIISPLLALMNNQIESAEKLHLCVKKINSENTDEWPKIRLGLPYVEALAKTCDARPQKELNNNNMQQENAFHSFETRGEVRDGNVLLVDDMVDSRWTFTCCGYKLRKEGSGEVFPFALADSASRNGED